ncbi:MAG: hypothetical protein JWN07_1431 [Hyphomicrobiales bacterium]|nr:hypothetical protein [Hyphomicrobiales bacterium]
MRRSIRVTVRLSLIPALLAAAFALPSVPAPAQETFLIPHDEGYGIAECLTAGSTCARTVADAWCSAMGRGPSVSFGLNEDETATIEQASTAPKGAGLRVTCR